MSNRKNETFNEVVIGLFMVVVIALLAYFTIVISGVDVLRGEGRVSMSIVFDQVGGLKDHDNVMYRGTKVGKVERVEVTPSNLVVVATVDSRVVLREKYAISVCNLSMLGGNYLLLEEGTGEPVSLAETRFVGQSPVDWMRGVTEITENVRKLTELPEIHVIISNVARVATKADRLVSHADAVTLEAENFMKRVNGSVDDVLATVSDARTFLTNATCAAQSIDSAAKKADDILGKLDDDKMIGDIEAGIAAFRKAAESLDAKALMAKAGELATNLNDLALKLKNGEGTLGKLANDPTLYNEVQGMIKDARQVLDNYRDTTPISTFSSLATGAL